MTTRYYDVVVLGMELGPLAAGALLAKRGFRVLAIGQNAPQDWYDCFQFRFSRRPFLLSSAESPAVRRVTTELGISQLFGHMLQYSSPAYQVVMPEARIDIHRDPVATLAEIQRELPGQEEMAGFLFNHLGRISGDIDKLFSNDIVIPPDSFMERREFARAEVQNPFRTGFSAFSFKDAKPSAELSKALAGPTQFYQGEDAASSPLPYHRLIAGLLFDCAHIDGGRDSIAQLLASQISGHGGDVQPRQSITEIIVNKGRVSGVRIADREEKTGCQVVLSDLEPSQLTSLVSPSSWTKSFRDLAEESTPQRLGYGINLGVDRSVVPAGLAQTCFSLPGVQKKTVESDTLFIEQIPQKDKNLATLHIACEVPQGSTDIIASGALRDDILDRMRKLIPFLDQHLHVIHSPFDAFGPIALTEKATGESPKPPHEEEIPKWLLRSPAPAQPLGIENLAHRAGIKGLLMCGGQVISGLGCEGEFIAAWGGARIASKMDPRRQRLVRSMRSKVEQ